MNTVVAIGFAEALSAPEVAWSLVDAGYRVVAFTRRHRRPALRHSHHVSIHKITAPEIDVATAARELRDFLSNCANLAPERKVLLPLDDVSLWLASREPLPAGWLFAGPDARGAAIALDKEKQVALAGAVGFRLPQTWIARRLKDLEPCSRKLPLILRPLHAVSESDRRLTRGRNWICADGNELEAVAKSWNERQPLLVQSYLDGVGIGVFGFSTPDGVTAWSSHRRLRMMNPHGSGSSACLSQTVPSELKEPIGRFLQEANWRGLFMIELLACGEDYLFVEFNGRSWGSMALARAQGLEYPAWTVRQTLDSKFMPEVSAFSPCKREARNLGRELMHLLFILRGPKSRAVRSWPKFGRALLDMLRFRPQTRIYNWRRDDQKVFWFDTFTTLREQLFKRRT